MDERISVEIDAYETPDVARIGSAESLTAGGATIDPSDASSAIN
jgi:hypothetical protein